jgi:lipopolysaccharide transport system ATP-binding protein
VAKFTFQMPYLPQGRYTVDAAIANGSYDAHTQADWTYDALVVESISSTVSTGLIGIPYHAIRIEVEDAAASPVNSQPRSQDLAQ